jgi:S-adenosyl methyltransferase
MAQDDVPDHADFHLGEDADLAGVAYSAEGFDPHRANVARVYDFWLGGKDNFAADRRVGAAVAELALWIVRGVQANRAFLVRAVTSLAAAGVDQFLDVGSGLPTMDNVHEAAQRVNPACRVVYVDHDPLVLAHARALLATGRGTAVCEGDLRKPQDLLDHPIVRGHLDWSRPVAVLMVSVLHFLTDADSPAAVVRTVRDAAVPGSFLVVSHVTPGDSSAHVGMPAAVREYTDKVGAFVPRPADHVRALLAGWDLLPPGLVDVQAWPDGDSSSAGRDGREPLPMAAGIARRATGGEPR